MTPDQILAFVLALTSSPPAESAFPVIAAGGADSRYPVTSAPCPRPLAPFEIEGQTVACGSVSVFEDHAKPDGRRIPLTFMIFKSRSLAPAPDAVVHLHGGPGVGIVERVALTSTLFEGLRARRDLVAFDQRGVDTSAGGETRCLATLADHAGDLVQGLADAAKPGGEGARLPLDVTRACLDELAASGADLSKINTEQNARDVQAVMRALGYPVFNVYGISYGTKLGLEVMRTAPDGVRAVVLDSVAPPHIPTYDTLALPHAESIEAIFTLCNADAACAAAYPNLKERFWALFSRLSETPIATSAGKIDGNVLFMLLANRNAHKLKLQGLTGYIPRLVAELEQGVTTTFDAITQDKLPPRQTPETVLTGLSGLDANSLALAQTALRLAQQGQIQEEALKTVLERLEADRAAVAAGAGLVDAFEAALLAGAKALPSPQARLAFASDYLRLRTQTPTREALSGLIVRHFAGETQRQLDALAGLMTPQNLADTFARISADNRQLDYLLVEGFQTQMFVCQEDMDINSPAGAAAVSARLQAEYLWPPEATKILEDFVNGFYASCELFPKHLRPGFHEPVTADIPTLVFAGLLDTQTAASWGPETARHLPRGQAIVLPETGHGALAFSQCARDLGVAFIENPTVALDTSCVAGLTPSFALPEAKPDAKPAAQPASAASEVAQ
ncbi:Tripeptidyl aminopeptidase precursor [Thiorhodovibrio winogradskyi]|uniref:Proline iminopeptidase n=1 Tax=Thiorhodovibrio winogradskyi TaxID=77007 RepID=A0ABZ0SAL9_9GAMM|nr:alpha/beta fold hydrolase [Thiorhodovibrio winogradskyi]